MFSEGKKQSIKEAWVIKLNKPWLLNYAYNLEENSLYCCIPAHWPLRVSPGKVKKGQTGKLNSKAQAV